jgi:transcriptional regulator with XRE-family HTH domain
MSCASDDGLRAARERLGKTQADIAEAFGLTQAAVSHWENHESAPHPGLWQQIADEYGVPLKRITEHFLKVKKAS